jgi:hypothetical protein
VDVRAFFLENVRGTFAEQSPNIRYERSQPFLFFCKNFKSANVRIQFKIHGFQRSKSSIVRQMFIAGEHSPNIRRTIAEHSPNVF